MKLIYTTFSDIGSAEAFCESALAQKLIACANILGQGRSFYRWEGAVQKGPEIYVLLKTDEAQLSALEMFFKQHHPYETPCFIVIAPENASSDYMAWVKESLK